MANNNFINECKNRANGNRLGQLIVNDVESSISNSNNLQNFSIDSGCYVDGSIIGTVYIKSLSGQFIALPDNVDLIDKTLYAKIGVKYANNTVEYINMGKYTIERPKDEQTANKCEITAYDDLINKIDNKYVCGIDYTSGIPPPEARCVSPSMLAAFDRSVPSSGIMPCQRSTSTGIRSVKALTRISGVISLSIQ